MKKLSAALLVLALCAGACFADEGDDSKHLIRDGMLAYSNMSTEEYAKFLDEGLSQKVWRHYKLHDPEYSTFMKILPDSNEYFDSLNEMIMALDAGRIDRMEMPQPVGKYFLKQGYNSSKYINYGFAQGFDYYLSMGFKDGSKWFQPFNSAIKAMNEDNTLLLLKAQYVDYAKDDPKPITFEKFPDAETVKIAVTGDMPPLDYIAADGSAAGFNTALLAEIGRRLKVNIELLSVNAGARAAALASGRADGVFWFWYDKATKTPRDVPAGVSLTEPYYSYDTFMYIGKKISK